MRVISQETFDAAVLENVTEFDMPLEEAISEAEREFSAMVRIKNYFAHGKSVGLLRF